jgi:hypothetical protein
MKPVEEVRALAPVGMDVEALSPLANRAPALDGGHRHLRLEGR